MKTVISILIILSAIGFTAWSVSVRVKAPNALPRLPSKWDEQVCLLDDDEAVRFVSHSITARADLPRATKISQPDLTHSVFKVNPHTKEIYPIAGSWGAESVRHAISRCANIGELDLDFPNPLPPLPNSGDWFVRTGISNEQKMQALQSILSSLAGRQLVIEKRFTDREVILVRGKWAFHSGNDDSELHFYRTSDEVVRSPDFPWDGTLEDSFEHLEDVVRRKIVDEVSEKPVGRLRWKRRSSFDRSEDEKRLDTRLAELQRQTSLEFIRTHRQIPIWFLREKSLTTQS